MSDDQPDDQATLFPKTAGERLREAREAGGLTLNDIAARTRVPLRHLEAIEQGRFDAMPTATYAVGFAKAYARAVGLDEVAIAAEVRTGAQRMARPMTDYPDYAISDPKRLPSRTVVIGALGVALALLVGIALWYGAGMAGGSGDRNGVVPPDAIAAASPTPATATPVPATGGQVVLTATDTVWLRVYDAAGKTLVQKTLQPGERYDVPVDAADPMINVGRPDRLAVTLNGSAVPPLGDGTRAIKDVPIGADALRKRGSTPAAAEPRATAPAGAGTPRPRRSPSPRASSAADDRPAALATPRATAPSATPAP
ncbi:helix-turn-helix domain-containing protein [uncultured Sphingomonas sp.]|uniref:helix-turn-helix domain-containing protein n=1 Tax=uncultured Sphingomonas sp. TaxID=158754 RepID=UPI0035CC3AD1